MSHLSFSMFDCVELTIPYVGAVTMDGEKIQSVLASNGAEVVWLSQMALIEPYLYAGRPDCLFLDIDSFGGITINYDLIRKVRYMHPSVPVIMVSAEFAQNEFGTHRLSLVDVSLKAPASVANIEIALFQAFANNRIWRQRQSEMPDILSLVR